MSEINVVFLGEQYSFPADLLEYLDILSLTESVQESLHRALDQQVGASSSGLIGTEDMHEALTEQASIFVGKLCEKGIFSKTIAEYAFSVEGYKLFNQANEAHLEAQRRIFIQKIDTFMQDMETAERNAVANITGTGVRVISSSFATLAAHAAYEYSVLKNQAKTAEAQYSEEIARMRRARESAAQKQEADYLYSTYLPNAYSALTVLAFGMMDRYISDLMEAGLFNQEALKYVDIRRSVNLLQNLKLSSNKKAVLKSAFVACPYNVQVYLETVELGLLDYDSFQVAQTLKQGEKILDSLRKELVSPESSKRRLHYRNIELISLYTNTPLREVTAYMADFAVDCYAKTVAILTDRQKCINVLTKAGKDAILQGDRISREKSAWLVDPIVPAALWDKLVSHYGHDDLLDRLVALFPDISNVTTKEQFDSYLKEQLYAEFEVVRKELVSAIKEKEAAQLTYERTPKARLKKYWLKYNILIVIGVVVLAIIIWLANSPKTVDSGDGWSHQVDDFNKLCEHCDGQEEKATHRIHSFFGNDYYYCDACWYCYGEEFFERLKESDSE